MDLTTWEGGGGTAPGATSSPSPSNGSSNTSIGTNLGWNAATGATQYDVYFGTSTNPPLVSSNQSSTAYALGTLGYSTTYYWRVDSENSAGVTQGTLWSFTTEADPGPGGGPIFFDGFESGSLGGWNGSNNDARVGSNAATGSFAAELRKSSSITQTIPVGGASSVTVSWDWRTSGYDNGERVRCTITGGSSTVTVDSTAGSYTSASRVISGVSGAVTVQFSTNANRKNERAYIDNVEVQ